MNKYIIILMLLTKTLLLGYSQGGGSSYHHKRWVLNNTDHFYVGFDKGLLFDFGHVAANDPQFYNWICHDFGGNFNYNFAFT